MNITPKKILVIKQSSLGDIVHTLPLVHALNRVYPKSIIGWVINKNYASLLAADPAIDFLHEIEIPSTSEPGKDWKVYIKALRATVSTLKKLRTTFAQRQYKLVLDLHASFKSGLIGLLNTDAKRIGFADARELNNHFQHILLSNPENKQHALDKNLLFANYLGCPVQENDFRIDLYKKDYEVVDNYLKEQSSLTAGFIHINPTARWQSKFWSQKKWAELADRLVHSGYAVIFGGSKQDLSYIEAIQKKMQHNILNTAGIFNLRESSALLKRAILHIGLDSGPMHIAAMVKTPVVALFGPTHPERVHPYGVDYKIVQAGSLNCLCCRKRVCASMACMDGIHTNQVFAATRELLNA